MSIQSYIQIIITIFGVFFYLISSMNVVVLYVLALSFVTFILKIMTYRIGHDQNNHSYVMLKEVMLLIYVFFIGSGNIFVQAVAIISFSLIYVEMMMLSEPQLPEEKQKLMFMSTVPVIIGSIIHLNIYGVTIVYVFTLVLFVVYTIGLTQFISYFVNAKAKIEDALHKEIKSQHFEKESLLLEKMKYKNLHTVMSGQKYELEKKNLVLNRISAEMYTQSELLRYISSVLDIEELMGLVTDSIIGAIGVDTCMLVIYEQDTGSQYYKVTTSIGKDLLDEFKLSVSNGLFSEYFKIGKPYMDADVDDDLYAFVKDRNVGSLIIVPLIRMGVAYGLLIAEHSAVGMFDENSLNFFKSITSQISIAVNNANIYSKMEEMAIKDGLTGLYNRREIQKQISDAIYNNKTGETISLALFDIDRFKRVNDAYGHLFGDEALKAISAIANKFAKDYDGVAGRYGGEEFILMLPGKNLSDAEVIMNSFHQAIKELVLIYNKTEEVKINISLGLSAYPDLANDTESLLSRADNAMYYAKKHGRGQVIVDHKNFGKSI